MAAAAMETDALIIGAGPAGLYAAQLLAGMGHRVTVVERMPSPARKLLLAGRGGLNLTHSEPLDRFVTRYGDRRDRLEPLVRAFTPDDLRAWAADLGIETYIGSSGRVFPVEMKASTLTRAWMRRLEGLGVRLITRRRWLGFTPDGGARLAAADGVETTIAFNACLLALGGASWPRTGSDGGWTTILSDLGVAVAPLRPANAGYRVEWVEDFAARFQGQPVKPAALSFGDVRARGEFVITATGIEGGAVYALGGAPRDAVLADGAATIMVDLKPEQSVADLTRRLSAPRGRKTIGRFVREALGLSDPAYALLIALSERAVMDDPARLAAVVKTLPLRLSGLSPIARAISTAGGVSFDAVSDELELRAPPGVYVAGEMLDWEAPTGGYLLQGCFASAAHAARAMARRLGASPARDLNRP